MSSIFFKKVKVGIANGYVGSGRLSAYGFHSAKKPQASAGNVALLTVLPNRVESMVRRSDVQRSVSTLQRVVCLVFDIQHSTLMAGRRSRDAFDVRRSIGQWRCHFDVWRSFLPPSSACP